MPLLSARLSKFESTRHPCNILDHTELLYLEGFRRARDLQICSTIIQDRQVVFLPFVVKKPSFRSLRLSLPTTSPIQVCWHQHAQYVVLHALVEERPGLTHIRVCAAVALSPFLCLWHVCRLPNPDRRLRHRERWPRRALRRVLYCRVGWVEDRRQLGASIHERFRQWARRIRYSTSLGIL